MHAPSYFGSIPSGLPGVAQTLKVMVAVTRAALNPDSVSAWSKVTALGFHLPFDQIAATRALLALRTTAQQVVMGCPEKDFTCEAMALQGFVRDRIRYTRDMRTAETVQFPDKTLSLQSGDCDDKAILLVTLAETIGFAGRFCAIGVRQESYSHVSAQVLIPGRGWVNAETIPIDSHGGKASLGWFPPDATCLMLAHV
jgi:Transglutaminase-like superfamily